MDSKIKYIDIGNTHTKILEGDLINLYPTADISNGLLSLEKLFMDNLSSGVSCDTNFVVSGVVPSLLKKIEQYLKDLKLKYISISRDSDFSFDHKLKGVGVDRLLAVEGALSFLEPPFVVIDAGTAITVDFVDRQDTGVILKGGLIIPGFKILADSLTKNTSQLPEINISYPQGLIAEDTVGAINNGVGLSLSYGIQGVISSYKKNIKLQKIKIVLTGGMSPFLSRLMNSDKYCLEDLDIIEVKDLIFIAMKKMAGHLKKYKKEV